MFVDASALVAILSGEAGGKVLAQRLQTVADTFTSPVAIFEAGAALSRKTRLPASAVSGELRTFLRLSEVEVRPISEETGLLALEAFERYGKRSGHPARLNLGDCFAYAMARQHGATLLYKGDDFALTDLA